MHPTQEPIADTTFTLPRGGEDLSFTPAGTLWSGSESGSDYFQKRPNPWPSVFPFIYEISSETLFGDIELGTGVDERQSPATRPRTIELNGFPNPFNNNLEVVFNLPAATRVTLQVFDLYGREVVTLLQGPVTAGSHHVKWQAHGMATGLYFLSLDSSLGRTFKSVALIK